MQEHSKSWKVARMGLLFALAMVLSVVEGLLPGVPGLPPGIKLGLSNVVTMYGLFFMGNREACTIALLKSSFVALTRGVTAGALSGAGGLVSIGAMIVLLAWRRANPSYFSISAAGAVFHNIGQLCMAALLLKSRAVFAYLPVLIIAGVLMGAVTATILKVLYPYFQRLHSTAQNKRDRPEND